MHRFFYFLTVAAFFVSCATVPITGRKQLAVVPNSQIIPMSFDNYQQVLKESKLSTNATQTALIKKVGKNIQTAVEQYMKDNNLSSELAGYSWEFNLIESEQVNAWCMPGGKVAFYTGILPICKEEAGIAVVMGHEVAHAIASHGRERMSQGLVQQLGGIALSEAIKTKPQETQALFHTAYAIGTQYGAMLPYSRLHETEADKLGLIFMAMAGYDPHEAPKLWERMKALSGGASVPEFMSTHPSNDTRIKELNQYMPEALKYYKK
jgi:predicted Zn-dependent protease